MAKPDCPAAFLRRVMEMGFRLVVAAVSFVARFLPAPGLFAVVPSVVCRCPIRFATVGFVPAAGPFDLVAVAVLFAAAAVLSAADLSVAADPGFSDSAGP